MPVAVRGWQQAAVALISDTTWEIPLRTSAQPSPQINCCVAMGGANRVVAGLLLVVVTTVVAAVALHQQALAHAAVGAVPQSTSSSTQPRPSGNSSLSLLGLHTSGTTRASVRGTNDVAISRMGSSSILHVLQRSTFLSAREQQTMGKSLLLRSVHWYWRITWLFSRHCIVQGFTGRRSGRVLQATPCYDWPDSGRVRLLLPPLPLACFCVTLCCMLGTQIRGDG